MSYTIWEKPATPLTEEQRQEFARALKARLGELTQEVDESRVAELEAKREIRLVRQELESLTAEERAEFDALHGPLAATRRLAEQARKEADAAWDEAEQQRQFDALLEWRKSKGKITVKDGSGNVIQQRDSFGSRDEQRRMLELSKEGEQRARERLAARERRELEAEAHVDEMQRVLATLDQEERAVFNRLLDEQPSPLQLLQAFKAERRNPIENIDSARELYRMASSETRPRKGTERAPAQTDVETTDDPKTLFKMASKQIPARKPK